MAKQSVSKKYSVTANGVLEIQDGVITIDVEDVGSFRLDKLLNDFNGYPIKVSVSMDEEQSAPEMEVDPDTGEILL